MTDTDYKHRGSATRTLMIYENELAVPQANIQTHWRHAQDHITPYRQELFGYPLETNAALDAAVILANDC
jgi:hypothetical protein